MTITINRNALNIDVAEKMRFNSVFFERINHILLMPPGARVLEVGCGGGELLGLMSSAGFDCYGIEPFPQYSSRFNQARVLRAYSEKLPFESGSFDLVIAKDVLEHVSDVRESIAEMVRVSRKYVYVMSPNYLYPYEAHFKVPFIPFLPKMIARTYLRFFGFSKREVEFINHIHYVSKFSVFRAINGNESVGTVVDLQLSKKREMVGPLVALLDLLCNYKFELLIVKK